MLSGIRKMCGTRYTAKCIRMRITYRVTGPSIFQASNVVHMVHRVIATNFFLTLVLIPYVLNSSYEHVLRFMLHIARAALSTSREEPSGASVDCPLADQRSCIGPAPHLLRLPADKVAGIHQRACWQDAGYSAILTRETLDC